MKQKAILSSIFALFLLIGLQLIPLYIQPDLLIINNRFALGYFNSNTLAILVLLLFLLLPIIIISKSTNSTIRFAATLLLASTSSNLLDRLSRGGVIDYISIGHWPTFNIADILIVISIMILGINYLVLIKKPRSD